MDHPELRISFRQINTLSRRILQLIPGRALGLQFARQVTLSTYGVLGMAMMAAPTLGAALRLGIQYRRACGVPVDPLLEVGYREFSITYGPGYLDADTAPFHFECSVASAVKFFRGFIGETFAPIRLEFSYPAPAYREEYETAFRCPMLFEEPQTRLVADAGCLAIPLPTQDPLTLRQVIALMDCAADVNTGGHELVESIKALRKDLRNLPSLEQLAQGLNLRERTLRRRLAENGRSYRAIVEGVRKDVALELIKTSGKPPSKIGAIVGFADPKGFRRALQRWTRGQAELDPPELA